MALEIKHKKSDFPIGYREPEGDGYKNLSTYDNLLFYITDSAGTQIKYSREIKEGYNPVVVKSNYLIHIWLRKAVLETLKEGKLKLTVNIITTNSEVTGQVSTVFEDYILELQKSSAQ